jgi:hypothetical protein
MIQKDVERAKVTVNMPSLTVPGRASSSSFTALVLIRWLVGVDNTVEFDLMHLLRCSTLRPSLKPSTSGCQNL